MIYKVELLAFEHEGVFREVDVPAHFHEDASAGAGSEIILLDLIFRYGQNDVQPRPCPSISVGDVVHLDAAKYFVDTFGFERLSEEMYSRYKSLPRGSGAFGWENVKRRFGDV